MTNLELLEALVQSKSLELVRQTRTRDVFKGRLNGQEFYVKSFSNRNFFEQIKRFFRGSPAWREHQVLVKLERLKIGAPQPVAYIESKKQSVLITKALNNCHNLKSILASRGFDLTEKIQLLKNLANFIRKLHDAGYIHTDLHAGNILVKLPQFEYFIIDPLNSCFKAVSNKDRLEQLADLIFSIYKFFNRTDIIRFARYCGVSNYRELIPFIERARERYLASRQQRCLTNSSEFIRFKTENGDGFARKDVDRDSMFSALKDAKAVKTLENRELLLFKDVFIKSFTPSLQDKALLIWKNSHGLKLREISTFKCYMYFQDSKKSYVFGEWVEGSLPISNFIRDNFSAMSRSRRNDFIFKLAVFVHNLHETGVFHKDLKANNIIVKNGTFYIIDIEDISFKKKLEIYEKVKNLAQLNAAIPKEASRSDRLRFFNYYAGAELQRNRETIINQIMTETIKRHHIWP